MKYPVLAWAAGACALALALPADAANGSMPNAMVRDAAAARRFDLQQRAEKAACEGMKRNANPLCASGAGPAREKVKKT